MEFIFIKKDRMDFLMFMAITFLVMLIALCFSSCNKQEPKPEILSENPETEIFTIDQIQNQVPALLLGNIKYGLLFEVQADNGSGNNVRALIQLSSLACDYLGIEPGALTQVWFEEIVEPSPAASGLRQPKVMQTGIALTQNGGTEFIAFHPFIPISTQATLINTANGQSATVTIQGRVLGDYDHIMVISQAVAQKLDINGSGEVYLETK